MRKLSVFKSSLTSSKSGSKESVNSKGFLENLSCIKISYFFGADDHIHASDWIELYDIIATDYNWTPANKLARLGGYLRKHALVWYIETMKTHPIENSTWISYKEMFSKRFISFPISVEKSTSAKSDSSSMSSA